MYVVALLLLFIFIVATPTLVSDGFSIFTEEHIEVTLLVILTVASFILYKKYRDTIGALEERYSDLTKHVGALNLQTVQVEALFNEAIKLPKNKRDIRRTIDTVNTSILSAVSVDWVMIRLVDTRTRRTLTEQLTTRAGVAETETQMPEISNKLLLEHNHIPGLHTFHSNPENSYVAAYCVFPTSNLNKHQHTVIRAAVNNISILYLILRPDMTHANEGE